MRREEIFENPPDKLVVRLREVFTEATFALKLLEKDLSKEGNIAEHIRNMNHELLDEQEENADCSGLPMFGSMNNQITDPNRPLKGKRLGSKLLFLFPETPLNRHLLIKQRIEGVRPLKLANEEANLLMQLTESEFVKEDAIKEYWKFYDEFRIYMNVLMRNINMMKAYPEYSHFRVFLLPRFPKFSIQFISTLSTELMRCLEEGRDPFKPVNPVPRAIPYGPQATNPAGRELGIKECAICMGEMTNLAMTFKCRHCLRRFHCDCVIEWLTNSQSCPTCRKMVFDERYLAYY
uniref:RING-type domain-containing protein n=1 Tax=Caenorhabditis tropicalis TaxID=1561998 RepID=A0A1I7TYR5_9PELO